MKCIIDTHIYLWALAAPDRIAENKRRELESQANIVYVSSITIAELMIKVSLNKLNIDFNPVDMALQSGFDLLDYSSADALLLKDLPFHHRDPFDRMLISQSLATGYPLMTDDAAIRQYDCELI